MPTLPNRVRSTDEVLASAHLKHLLPEGSTVSVVIRSVSSTGMTRRVSVLCPGRLEHRATFDGTIRDITGMVARLLGWSRDTNGYIAIRGTGFSAANHVVGAVSLRLYGDEYRLRYETL